MANIEPLPPVCPGCSEDNGRQMRHSPPHCQTDLQLAVRRALEASRHDRLFHSKRSWRWGRCATNHNTDEIEIYYDGLERELGSVTEFYGGWCVSVEAYGGVVSEKPSKEEAKREVERLAAESA